MLKTIVFLFLPFFLPAQTILLSDSLLDMNMLSKENKIGTKKIAFYRKYISSQDGSVCSFYPSCSAYLNLAVRNNGFWLGALLTVDRITRCNGHHHEFYEFNGKRNKPVDFPPLR